MIYSVDHIILLRIIPAATLYFGFRPEHEKVQQPIFVYPYAFVYCNMIHGQNLLVIPYAVHSDALS